MNLTIDSWDANRNTPSEDDAPTTASIREAVNRLDGRRHTEVTLGTDEPFAYLAVSGGPDLFLVTGETADDEILHLRAASTDESPVALVCGGQLAEYPRNHLVTKDAAVAALERFFDGQGIDHEQPWHIE